MNPFFHRLSALRLAFLPAVLLPFAFGSFYGYDPETWQGLLFGLGLLVAVLIAAGGLLADVLAEARADLQKVRRSYSYYRVERQPEGTGLLLTGSVVSFLAAGLTACALASLMEDWRVLAGCAVWVLVALGYAVRASREARPPWGTLCITAACGPIPVLAGHALQGGVRAEWGLLSVSLTFGLLAAAAALAYERGRGRTGGAGLAAEYMAVTVLAVLGVAAGVAAGILPAWPLGCVVILLPAMHAMALLSTTGHSPAPARIALTLAVGIHLMAGLLLLAGLMP